MLLNNDVVNKEIKGEIKKKKLGNKWKYDMPKFMGYSKSSSKREVHKDEHLN